MIFFFFVNFYHRELQGVIVTLDEGGYLHCAYLGTDPSMMVTPAPEARDINYEVSTRAFFCFCFFGFVFFFASVIEDTMKIGQFSIECRK